MVEFKVMFMLCGCYAVYFQKWKLLKYTLPVAIYSFITNIPKFFEVGLDTSDFNEGDSKRAKKFYNLTESRQLITKVQHMNIILRV